MPVSDVSREELAKIIARTKGMALLKNAMYGAIDPTEGDFYRGDVYNTARAAEGIRQYADDSPKKRKD